MSHSPIDWRAADWPVPQYVGAGTALRTEGDSVNHCAGLNLAMHVNDDAAAVSRNRARLCQTMKLKSDPVWLNQQHKNRILNLDNEVNTHDADGSTTTGTDRVCAILTADCVPVLMFNETLHRIAALHVGWRGLCHNIIGSALTLFAGSPEETLVWIGPHICAEHYETGNDVYEACLKLNPAFADTFTQTRTGHWLTNLGLMIKIQLNHAGIEKIYHTDMCTFEHSRQCFSYRRDGETGRMATLIWMTEE